MRRSDLHHAVAAKLVRYQGEHSNHYGVVPDPPFRGPVRLGAAGPLVDRAMVALGRLAARPATGLMLHLRARILTRQEALSSSGMEGTHSTLDAVLGLDTQSDGDAPARQIRSYALALEQLLPKAQGDGHRIFTPALYHDAHKFVMADDPAYPDMPGAYRQVVVWIGGAGHGIAYSTWNPPGPEFLAECMQQNADYLQDAGPHLLDQPLLVRLAIAHAHFEAVHPFRDGNGRVGRLLIPLILAAEGQEPVYLSPWIEANKARYNDGLKAAQQRLDYAPLTAALAEAIIATEQELTATETALEQLGAHWAALYPLRRGSSAARLLQILPWLPVLSLKTAQQELAVSPKAANDGLARLCDLGLLREMTGYSRNRLYEAPEVMQIITRPFGAPPILPGDLSTQDQA